VSAFEAPGNDVYEIIVSIRKLSQNLDNNSVGCDKPVADGVESADFPP